MAPELNYDVCPETGIGCVMLRRESGLVKLDLMPDEVDRLKQLAAANDTAGIKALLKSVSDDAAALDDDAIEALVRDAR